MSLRHEQYSALLRTRDFMRGLIDAKKTPRVPLKVRMEALGCLRHYPFLKDDGEPMFSKDNFKA